MNYSVEDAHISCFSEQKKLFINQSPRIERRIAVRLEKPRSCGSIETSVQKFTGDFFVAFTKWREEKHLAAELTDAGIQNFLPLVRRSQVRNGNRTHIEVPLFPNYVFFAGDGQSRYTAIMTHRTLQVLDVKGRERTVNELHQVQMALAADNSLGIFRGFHSMQKCRIRTGKFEGIEGFVDAFNRRKVKIVLRISMLGQSVAIDCDPENLEPAE